MKLKFVFSLLVVFLFCFESIAEAQGRRGGGRGVSRTALIMVDQVQEELEISDEQKTSLSELPGANRGRRGGGERGGERGKRGGGERGERGGDRGKRGGGERGERGGRGGGGERGGRGGRGGGGERGGRGQQTAEQAQEEIDALKEVLLPHQMTRLEEIYIQVLGATALRDPMVMKALEITEEQTSEMQELQDEMREEMRDLRDSTDPEDMQDKLKEMTEELTKDTMALLTDDQSKKLEEMKGDKFELPEDAMPRGRGGRRGGNRDRSDF